MAETFVEEKITEKDIYGITPEVREKYRRKLEELIKVQEIKAVKTKKDLYSHSENSGQTQEEIQAEVDEFLQMLEAERKLSLKRER
ncbi:MAG: hypothetical protein ACR2F2_00145 [Pyrinomonadaceae bacterium]